MADAVVTNVMNRLDPIIMIMDNVAERMWEASLETRTGVDRLYRTCEEMRDELKRVMEGEREEIVTSCNLHITLLTNLG